MLISAHSSDFGCSFFADSLYLQEQIDNLTAQVDKMKQELTAGFRSMSEMEEEMAFHTSMIEIDTKNSQDVKMRLDDATASNKPAALLKVLEAAHAQAQTSIAQRMQTLSAIQNNTKQNAQ